MVYKDKDGNITTADNSNLGNASGIYTTTPIMADGHTRLKELLLENKDNLIGDSNFGSPISEYRGATEIDYYKALNVIPVEWLRNKIDETEDKLFELTKDKSRSLSLDEIFAFKDLDLYAYTLKKIYYDYTGEYYEGNHYMLREKESEQEET